MADRRVFVGAGTDHHGFDRLIDWSDAAAERWVAEGHDQRLGTLRLTVQHGASRPPRHGHAVTFLGGAEIAAIYAESEVIVLSCGPGGVMDARDAGRRPVVVARRRGEAVDDHQLAFAEHLDRYGLAFVASTPDELFDHILAILADPLIAAVTRASAEPPPGIAGVGGAIDRLVWTT